MAEASFQRLANLLYEHTNQKLRELSIGDSIRGKSYDGKEAKESLPVAMRKRYPDL